MQTLARLFGRSPFAPLQTHMEKVAVCVHEIKLLFDALKRKDYEGLQKIAEHISKLEHDADLTKNDHLPSGLFLPIARQNLLEILSLQDNLADCAENIAVLLTFRNLEILPSFENEFLAFLEKNLETFEEVYHIIQEMGELVESSFGGPEAQKVRKLVHAVAFKEHEADLLQRQLMRKMFQESDKMATPSFFLWMRVTQEIETLSDESEQLANRVRMILEIK